MGWVGRDIALIHKAYFRHCSVVLQYALTGSMKRENPRRMDQKTSQARRTHLDVIETFSGAFEFLSGFYVHPFAWHGRVAQTAEHHYNAARTDIPAEKSLVYEQTTPGRAKRVGQRVTLRQGWDDHLKTDCMASIIEAKFEQGSELAQRLLRTGEALLIEGNVWHDRYWGQCTCEKHYHWPGGNMLGRLLMDRRTELRGGPPPCTRVGITGHRPQSLSPAEQEWVKEALPVLMRSLRASHGMQVAISGFALGADTVWAQAALDQGVRLWGYLPSPDQAGRWRRPDQELHAELIARASRTLFQGETYETRWLRARNEMIVRDSNALVAVHKEGQSAGGTAAVIRKALASNKRIIRVNVTRQEIVAVTSEGEVPWVF